MKNRSYTYYIFRNYITGKVIAGNKQKMLAEEMGISKDKISMLALGKLHSVRSWVLVEIRHYGATFTNLKTGATAYCESRTEALEKVGLPITYWSCLMAGGSVNGFKCEGAPGNYIGEPTFFYL